MRTFIILLLLHSTLLLNAQSGFAENTVWSISFFNHSISVPIYDKLVKTPLNIGVTIGAEFTYKQNEISSMHQKVELGWYHHKHLNKAIYIKTDFINRFSSKSGVYAEYNVGVGYMIDIPEFQIFSLNDQGTFSSTKSGARGGALFSLGLGGGYDINVNDTYVVSPFIKYESMMQFPYSNFLPLFPHSMLHIGSRINL